MFFITGMGFSPRISMNFPIFSWVVRPQCFLKLHLSMAYLVLLDLVRHRLSPHLSAMVPIFHPKAGGSLLIFLEFLNGEISLRNPKECVPKETAYV